MVGNPSSIHSQGKAARSAIEQSRCLVAEFINADPDEIIFTSGGTESNNLAIGFVKSTYSSPVVITSDIEHHSIEAPISGRKWLRPFYLEVDRYGAVNLGQLESILSRSRGRVGLVSIMWANNEVGSVQPIKEIAELCHSFCVPFHSDAVAAAGHLEIDVKDSGVDMLSVSGHKIGAPQGVGFLYISRAAIPYLDLNPIISGGGQEKDLRSGTENVPGIVGLGIAASRCRKNLSLWIKKWRRLREVFIASIQACLSPITTYWINGDESGLPNLISLTIPGIESESLLLMLDQRGIMVSAGSACSSDSKRPSHVLLAMGLSEKDASSTIRISMGPETTEDEVKIVAREISVSVRRLQSLFFAQF